MAIDLLTLRQKAFLMAAGKDDFIAGNFYLTGGTALAVFYLGHRYSEDLDFFSEKEIDPLALDVFFKKIKPLLGIAKTDFQQSYNRNLVFLEYGDGEILKTEFTHFPFPRIEKGRREHGIRKMGFSIADLTAKARIKFDWHIDPLQLGTQFMKAREASDLPRMITPIAAEEWRGFFTEEAKKLRPEVLDN